MQTEIYQPRIPDEASLRAYSEGALDMGQLEERGFSIHEVRQGMILLKLPIPGHDLSNPRFSPLLDQMIRAHQERKKS